MPGWGEDQACDLSPPTTKLISERNFVNGPVVKGLLLRGPLRALLARPLRSRFRDFFLFLGLGDPGLSRRRLRGVIAPPQELHLGGGDFEAHAVVALAVRVLFLPQATFEVNLAAFGEVLIGQFSLAIPERHAKPGRIVIILARHVVLASLGGRNRYIANGRSLRRVSHLRVASQISDDGDLVE